MVRVVRRRRTTRHAGALREASQTRRLFFERLFPDAPRELAERALLDERAGLFHKSRILLPESTAYYFPQRNLLVTDCRRLPSMGARLWDEYEEIVVLRSQSRRARFFVTNEGRVFEFKGLTPIDYDITDININSGDPENLYSLGSAQNEAAQLTSLGAVAAAATPLGRYFPDLANFAQLMRTSPNRGAYLSWLRMDSNPLTLLLLAELEGVTPEKFMYAMGLRFGDQLRTLHKNERTLHVPYFGGKNRDFPFSSFLHVGNVEAHGNIVDLGAAISFRQAEKSFWLQCPKAEREATVGFPSFLRGRVGNDVSLSLLSRVADMQRFLGGYATWTLAWACIEDPRRSCDFGLFGQLFMREASGLFARALNGAMHGYYGLTGEKEREEVRAVVATLVDGMQKDHANYFSFERTYNLLVGMEEKFSL